MTHAVNHSILEAKARGLQRAWSQHQLHSWLRLQCGCCKQKNWTGTSITKKNVQIITDLVILDAECTAIEEMGGAGNTRKRLEDAFLLWHPLNAIWFAPPPFLTFETMFTKLPSWSLRWHSPASDCLDIKHMNLKLYIKLTFHIN